MVPGGDVVRPERLGESGAGDEGDDDVGGVPIEVLASPVVHRGRSWIGVAGGYLDFSEGYAGVKGGHDERDSQHVGMYQTEFCPLGDRSTQRCAVRRSRRCRSWRNRMGPSRRSPTARSMVRAVRGTSGMRAGLLPLPTMRSTR